jgi:DNA-binding response OmpR family regulator
LNGAEYQLQARVTAKGEGADVQLPNRMTPQGGQRQQILIVEDERLIALDVEDRVRELGYEVVGPAGNLEDALRIVATERIDGALLDIHLNGDSTSYPVAAELESRGIPFLFVTGLDKGGIAALFPGAAVVRKPFYPAALGAAIKHMMTKR